MPRIVSSTGTPAVFRRVVIADEISIGGTLRAAREALGFSIAECSRAIVVPERYLKAIEAEDFEALPGLVYEKHFITRYAQLLHVTVETTVLGWEELREEVPTRDQQFAQRVGWKDLMSGPTFWRRIGASTGALALVLYLGAQLVTMAAPPKLAIIEPTAGAIVTTENLIIAGNVTQGARISINGQSIIASPDGLFTVPVRLGPGPNSIRIVAEKRYGRPAILERQVYYAASKEAAAIPSEKNSL